MDKKNITKSINKIIIFLALFFVLLLKAKFAYALEVTYPSIFGMVINASTTFAQYACYIFGLITNASLLICVVAVVFGGVSFLRLMVLGNLQLKEKTG